MWMPEHCADLHSRAGTGSKGLAPFLWYMYGLGVAFFLPCLKLAPPPRLQDHPPVALLVLLLGSYLLMSASAIFRLSAPTSIDSLFSGNRAIPRSAFRVLVCALSDTVLLAPGMQQAQQDDGTKRTLIRWTRRQRKLVRRRRKCTATTNLRSPHVV